MWGEKARRMSLGWRQALTLSIPGFGDSLPSFLAICIVLTVSSEALTKLHAKIFYRWVNIEVSPKPDVKQKIQSFSLFKI